MQIKTRKSRQVNILELYGKFCLGHNTETLLKTIGDLVNQGEKNFLIELSRVTHLDSSGVGTLVSSFQRICTKGGKCKLLSPSKPVRDVLTLVRLTSVFEIFEKEQTAIASFPS